MSMSHRTRAIDSPSLAWNFYSISASWQEINTRSWFRSRNSYYIPVKEKWVLCYYVTDLLFYKKILLCYFSSSSTWLDLTRIFQFFFFFFYKKGKGSSGFSSLKIYYIWHSFVGYGIQIWRTPFYLHDEDAFSNKFMALYSLEFGNTSIYGSLILSARDLSSIIWPRLRVIGNASVVLAFVTDGSYALFGNAVEEMQPNLHPFPASLSGFLCWSMQHSNL